MSEIGRNRIRDVTMFRPEILACSYDDHLSLFLTICKVDFIIFFSLLHAANKVYASLLTCFDNIMYTEHGKIWKYTVVHMDSAASLEKGIGQSSMSVRRSLESLLPFFCCQDECSFSYFSCEYFLARRCSVGWGVATRIDVLWGEDLLPGQMFCELKICYQDKCSVSWGFVTRTDVLWGEDLLQRPWEQMFREVKICYQDRCFGNQGFLSSVDVLCCEDLIVNRSRNLWHEDLLPGHLWTFATLLNTAKTDFVLE